MRGSASLEATEAYYNVRRESRKAEEQARRV